MDYLEKLLSRWSTDQDFTSHVENWSSGIPSPSMKVDIPFGVHPVLKKVLESSGIHNLYSHQGQSFDLIQNNKNIILVTGTASGKSLCYNLPVLNYMLKDDQATALYIFPTKALSQDQAKGVNHLIKAINQFQNEIPEAVIYDGDTSSFRRNQIRQNVRLLITNPDMLHLGILPHHPIWDRYLKNLKFIVIDEAHIYRGVFGSHIANVVRRLKRICNFYNAYPQFILTSATISNPDSFAEKLVEEEVEVITEDGSPRGARHFILYNPPYIDQKLGIRRSAYAEAVDISKELYAYKLQTILFTRSRRSVEKLLLDLRSSIQALPDEIRGYRSGYLAQQRREIESGLKNGEVKLVTATNALELGVDIGELKVAILVGYPGSIAALRQQSGRAGRKASSSLAIMITTPGAIDQYLAKHPEFLNKSPENALIDPDNLVILLQHLRSAAFELPFSLNATFGKAPAELINGLLGVLAESNILSAGKEKYYWSANQYPANEISLRSATVETITLQTEENHHLATIGEIDPHSAYWMTHPQAIYLHDGIMYKVDDLNLKDKTALLSPAYVDYLTEAVAETKIEKLSTLKLEEKTGCLIGYGEMLVSSQVTGYKKIHLISHELMGQYPLDMPVTQLRTTGYWISLKEETVQILRQEGKWNSDFNQYGNNWEKITSAIRRRDQYRCQLCGAPEKEKKHHVHHKIPLRNFLSLEEANRPQNLITLCPNCHQRAEAVVRMKSGLSGMKYALQNLAPLFLMCDINDIGALSEPESDFGEGLPSMIIYDMASGGIGLSEHLYNIHDQMLKHIRDLVAGCDCLDGCPACVGPGGENGSGGKAEALAILSLLVK